MNRRRCRRHDDRGLVSIEMVLGVTLVLTMIVPLVLFAGRVTQGSRMVWSAAQAGSRAATLEDTPGAAERVARTVVDENLAAAGRTCSVGKRVTVDASALRPGGQVTVSVVCEESMHDLIGLGLPATRRFWASSTQLVDVHRSAS